MIKCEAHIDLSLSPGQHCVHLLLRALQRRADGGDQALVPVQGAQGAQAGPQQAGPGRPRHPATSKYFL